jgi:transcriptional repressor NrdR
VICPACNANDDKVIDSRPVEGGKVIRRRRECLKCTKRFSTYERIEQASRLVVVKRDGTREPFDTEKILRGIHFACGKRKLPEDAKQRIVEEIDDELHREFDREVTSEAIGLRVGQKLLAVDEVAFIRFRSEFLQLNRDQLMREIEELLSRPREIKSQQSLFIPPAPAEDGKK